LAPGDELVIAEWDRATRSMWDGLQILKEIIDAGAQVRVLDRTYIDLTSPIGRGFMAFISAMAEDERLRIIKRTREGRAVARDQRWHPSAPPPANSSRWVPLGVTRKRMPRRADR
jgi:DNA invertase Pin-like site-specific DNA recombinase